MALTITDLVDGIATGFSSITSINQAQSNASLTDGMMDTPAVQIYFDTIDQSAKSGTDRMTMQAGVRATRIMVNVDVYVQQRSLVGEDIALVHSIADDIVDYIETQDTKPYFGVVGIKSFRWTAERVTFAYGQQEIKYAGIRFQISCLVG